MKIIEFEIIVTARLEMSTKIATYQLWVLGY